jgi:predicted amidohydrolase
VLTPEQFRGEYNRCDWIFDLFAHSFDFLNSRFTPPTDGPYMGAWSFASDQVAHLRLVDLIVSADGTIPVEVLRYIALPLSNPELESEAFRLRLFCVLTAIDNAASDLNYLGAATRYTSTRWSNVATHLERNGKQLQSAARGNVVLKPKYFTQAPWSTWLTKAIATDKWVHLPSRGEYLSTYFENLLRISNRDDCGFEVYKLPDSQDFPHADWATLRIGIVPLIEELKVGPSNAQLLPGPLVLRKETVNPSTFGIHIEPGSEECTELCDHAEAALRHLVRQGCQIILFPEMVAPERVVKRLAMTLRKMEADRELRPALVLAGSFTRMVPAYPSDKPFNVAVALDHRGFEICRQRKTQPYDMKRHEQKKFGLEPILDSDSCRENIAFSDRILYLVDSPASGVRMLILICEDLAQDPGLQAIREFHPTLVLAPVMAGPLTESSGFATSLKTTLDRVSSIFVVANSAGMAKAAWKPNPGNPPLGLIGLPLLSVPQGYKPLEILSDLQATPGSPSAQVLVFQFPR